MKRLFTFLVEIPDDGDWDADDVREEVGSGAADMYDDQPIDLSEDEESDGAPCCPDPGCPGWRTQGRGCTFPGYADNH